MIYAYTKCIKIRNYTKLDHQTTSTDQLINTVRLRSSSITWHFLLWFLQASILCQISENILYTNFNTNCMQPSYHIHLLIGNVPLEKCKHWSRLITFGSAGWNSTTLTTSQEPAKLQSEANTTRNTLQYNMKQWRSWYGNVQQRQQRTLSFLRALNFLSESTVCCRCTLAATRSLCCRHKQHLIIRPLFLNR